MELPRIVIAGVRGGSGKTIVSLGIAAAWRKTGRSVSPFKKGPDYIDAAWLTRVAGRPCRNLDAYLMSAEVVKRSFAAASAGADVAVIEGNRGLHDGLDARGSYSTAELAKLLQCPVVLAVDCTKATRTIAAIVRGCQELDRQVKIGGVVLNHVAGRRHESVLCESVEQICGVPVLGSIPRLDRQLFPERHLGLVPPDEHERLAGSMQQIADVAEEHLDLAAIWKLAKSAPALPAEGADVTAPPHATPPRARIGVFRDAAFQFYYPENLEALQREGAQLVEVSPMRDAALPGVDALYIGGGFPETMAPALAGNEPFLEALRRAVEAGLPVYAECGGAVFLGRTLHYEERRFDLAGVLPVEFAFRPRPQGHGYAELEAVEANPYFTVGQSIRGHEFHYTYMVQMPSAEDLAFAFRVVRGHGFDGQRDGLIHRNVLACYTHVHALGTEAWAPSLVRAAGRFASYH